MAAISTLTDTFATQDTAKWQYYGGATATGGQLSVPILSSYAAGVDTVTKATYDLTNSAILVEAILPAVGSGSKEIFLEVRIDGNSGEAMYVSGSTLYFREKVAGTPDQTSIAYDPVAHRWWRIRTAAGTIYWDTSPNGYAWTTQRSKTVGITITALIVYLGGGYWGTETASSALFDNVNTAPAAPASTNKYFF